MKAALFHRDILDFLATPHRHRVRCLVVGGGAVIKYGYARLTADTDIFYDRDARNVARLFSALRESWGGDIAGADSANALRQKGSMFPFGAPPDRRDLLNDIDGVSFSAAWKGRAARHKDLDDLRFLLEARSRRRGPRRGTPRGR